MVDENVKSYEGCKEVTRVISSTSDACNAVAEIMEAADMDSTGVAFSCLKYIDNTIKPDKKRLATLLLINDLTKAAIGSESGKVDLVMVVDGKNMSIDDYIKSRAGDSIADKLKDILGDGDGSRR